MRNLIGERPNLVPAGIGNSSSMMDMSILDDDGEASLEPTEPAGILYDSVAEELLDDSDSEDPLPNSDGTGTTGTASTTADSDPPKTLTSARQPPKDAKRKADISDTNDKTTKRPPKKTKLEEFAAAAQAEEVTRQRELELAKAKVQSAAEVEVAREKAKVDARQCKKEERLMKNQLRLEKMRMKHEREMARYRAMPTATASHGPGMPASGIVGDFRFEELGPEFGLTDDIATVENTFV